MNLCRVLVSKVAVIACLSASVVVLQRVSESQENKQSRAKPQKEAERAENFGNEDPKWEHEVPPSLGAKKALASDESVAAVLNDEGLTVETMPNDWFRAAEIHLASSAETDLVVQGKRRDFLGAYTAAYWVLRRTADGYRIVFQMYTQDLEVLGSKTNGLRDIAVGVGNLRGVSWREFAFDGSAYQIVKRTNRPSGFDAEPDPAKYALHKFVTQRNGQNADDVRSEAREWIWERWQKHERACLEYASHDDDGETHGGAFFMDFDSQSGEAQVTVKILRKVWDQDSPTGPRYMVTEDLVYLASEVKRIEPPHGDESAEKARLIGDDEKVAPGKYRLWFKDSDSFTSEVF